MSRKVPALTMGLITGVRNTTTLFDRDPIDRLRRPRFIAKDGVVRPYNAFEGELFELFI